MKQNLGYIEPIPMLIGKYIVVDDNNKNKPVPYESKDQGPSLLYITQCRTHGKIPACKHGRGEFWFRNFAVVSSLT